VADNAVDNPEEDRNVADNAVDHPVDAVDTTEDVAEAAVVEAAVEDVAEAAVEDAEDAEDAGTHELAEPLLTTARLSQHALPQPPQPRPPRATTASVPRAA